MSESFIDKLSNRYDLSDDVQQKLAGLLDKYRSLDEDGRREFLTQARDTFKDQIQQFAASQTALRNTGWMYRLWFASPAPLLLAVLVIVLVFVFFGYKLYKSLSERERKREEKKKNKQMKKKK